MWRHPAFDGTHYISPRDAPHLSPGCTISHNVVPYVTLLFLLFGRGSRDIAERILYYESQYVVAFAYGVCGSTCAEIEEGDALPWLLLRFINDEQDGYNVCDELISADDISYAYVDIENRTIARTQSVTSSASYGDTLDLCETAKLLLKSLETGGNG